MLIPCAVKERSKRRDSLLEEVESKYIPSSMSVSVRAMQFILDRAVNTKIPDDLVHELQFK